MRQVTIELPDDIANLLEIRAAIDNLTLKEGIEALLAEVVNKYERSKRQ